MNNNNLVLGYPMVNGRYESRYLFTGTADNIANFIMANRFSDTTITDLADNLICNTIGEFIDKCPNQVYLRDKLLPALQKLQFGDAPVKPLKFKYDEENDCYVQI